MKFRENTAFFVILGAIIFFLYILLAIRPLGTELQMTPEWTVDILKAISQSAPTANLTQDNMPSSPENNSHQCYPFKLGQILGYFSEDGTITSITSFPYKATISDNYWITYTPDAANMSIYNKHGD